MPFTLDSTDLQLQVDPGRNLFSVEPKARNVPQIRSAHFSVRYLRGGVWYSLEDQLPAQTGSEPDLPGGLRGREILFGPNRHRLTVTMTCAVVPGSAELRWRLAIANGGDQPVFLGRIEVLRVGFAPADKAIPRRMGLPYPRGDYHFPQPDPDPAFFSNGWGSWNHTGAYGFRDRFHRTRLPLFNGPMRINPGTPQPSRPGHFASDLFAVLGDRVHRGALLLGFLSQRNHFGSLEVLTDPAAPALSLWANGDEMRLDPGASAATDWACLFPLHLDAPDPLGPYLEAVAREHGLGRGPEAQTPVGWCSWYHYYQKISAGIIRENLGRASEFHRDLPLDLIQIDDGWQQQVGDWDRFSPGFPDGPAPLAAEIRNAGLTPGLWLAPFILHPRSETAQAHPDWLLRNRRGRPVNAGYVWDVFTQALDLSLPAALEFAVETVRRAALDWGYPYLKLDFLYAGALAGRRADQSRTRAQILRQALEALRTAVGSDVQLLACGCPLGSAIGLFDAMRVNADVAPYWHPRHFNTQVFFKPEPDFPSARNALQNALTRAPLHHRWWLNDPDCLLLRPDSELTLAEVQSLAAVIALTGGSLLVSDDLTALPADRLRIGRQLIPPIGQRALAPDWFDAAAPQRLQVDLASAVGKWHLLAVFNWSDQPQTMHCRLRDFYLDPGKVYLAREFWTGAVLTIQDGELPLGEVPAHGCRVLALRPRVRGAAQYLGSDLHLSQGLEVKRWAPERDRLVLDLAAPGEWQGAITLALPGTPEGDRIEPLGDGIYQIPVRFTDRLTLDLRLA